MIRKFVEHGEYEKAYYGTSLGAIRSVVNSEKICVLNLHPQVGEHPHHHQHPHPHHHRHVLHQLHPQSLKILKSSDLMPYVVFVAPPSLQQVPTSP